MNNSFLPGYIYRFLFVLLGIVYIAGLFVPLMDNDSAHHADIALHMYLTGDYVSLVDHAGAYLDKPHLHFWLCALSYQLFGVTGLAYKLPSLLFTILGVYSTYRLGKILYNKRIGELAALIVASSFAFILANNDVRMDAILTSCIVFSCWQLIDFINQQKLYNAVLAALGLALGFSTKGHIAIMIPGIAALFHILYKKEYVVFRNWRLYSIIILFGIFISPVVYCYYLQYNLNPYTVVRGKDHINGVKFILFGQSVERFQGDNFGADSKHDYFFFIHSFLWAFAPWSIIAYLAVIESCRNFFSRNREWSTTAVFIITLLIVSFSGFKLPHYLNIVFPTTAVLTAAYIINHYENIKFSLRCYTLQLIISTLLLLGAALINGWAFPINNGIVMAAGILLLAVFFYFIKSSLLIRAQKMVGLSVASISIFFFLLNTNFYPKLLTYQGGNELALQTKGKVEPGDIYFWKGMYSSSFNFYTKTLRKPFVDTVIKTDRPAWLLFDVRDTNAIKDSGYIMGKIYSCRDYEITKLNLEFINPAKRDAQCTQMILGEIKK